MKKAFADAWTFSDEPFEYYIHDGRRNVLRTKWNRYSGGESCRDCRRNLVKVNIENRAYAMTWLWVHRSLSEQEECDVIRKLTGGPAP